MRLVQNVVAWLKAHTAINVALVFAYAAFILFMHDPMVHVSIWVMNLLTLPIYNKVVMLTSGVILLLYATILGRALLANRNAAAVKLTYLVATLLLMVVHFFTMFEMNIEIIHSMEYTLLCFLIYPLVGRYGAAIVCALPFMLIDEYNQYVWMYSSYTFYFEFNDIFMDIYGCGLVVTALAIVGITGQRPIPVLWKRPEFIALVLFVVVFFAALATGLISLYPGSEGAKQAWLVLNKLEHPELFWRQYPGRDVIYHVARPIEGVAVIFILCLFYMGLDRMFSTASK